jgi:peptidoglycan/LPS O-acetylase OafA/YrhL
VSRASQDGKFRGLLDRYKFSTIGEKYASAGLRPTGFDYLRITLAVALVLWHAILVGHGESWSHGVFQTQWKLPLLFLVPSFFSLRGFLIAGSLERSTIPVFIGLRILRIVPALTVDTLLTLLIVGPLFTILPLQEYFSNKMTWKYLLNIVGHIQFRLPGVFYHNPVPEIINGQLWTIPWEFACYATIVALAIVGIARSRSYFLVLAVIAPIVVLFILTMFYPNRFAPNSQLIAPTNIDLVTCFLTGVAIYQYRERIPHSAAMAILAVAGYAVLMNTQYAYVFSGALVAYITVWIGVTNYPKTFVIRGGDYSYGIYLYHLTLQQAIASLGILAWYAVFIVSLPLVTLLAAMSWRFVEKPALSLRGRLIKRFKPQQAQPAVLPELTLRNSPLSAKPSPTRSSSA